MRQRRQRPRELTQERVHHVDVGGDHHSCGRLGRRWRLCHRGRTTLSLRLQPALDPLVAQQFGKLAQLLRSGFGRLGQHRPGGNDRREQVQQKQQSTHSIHPLASTPSTTG